MARQKFYNYTAATTIELHKCTYWQIINYVNALLINNGALLPVNQTLQMYSNTPITDVLTIVVADPSVLEVGYSIVIVEEED
jgi:hypothetical protein